MAWLNDWWTALSSFQQALAIVAVPATVILLLQTILLLFGLGGAGDSDLDSHGFDTHDDVTAGDGHFDAVGHDVDHCEDGAQHVAGVRIFTVRGMVAFFAVGGWVGIAMEDIGLSAVLSGLVAFVAGFAAMLLLALCIKLLLRSQSNGNINLNNAVGLTGTVYITVPPSMSGTGKINLTVQGRYCELEAMTEASEPIRTGTAVTVSGMAASGRALLVKTEAKTAEPELAGK